MFCIFFLSSHSPQRDLLPTVCRAKRWLSRCVVCLGVIKGDTRSPDSCSSVSLGPCLTAFEPNIRRMWGQHIHEAHNVFLQLPVSVSGRV